MNNCVVLENIRSLYNIGNILRTADALGRDVVFSGYSASPDMNAKVKKTSLGAEESVSWRHLGEPVDVINTLKIEGFDIIAAEISSDSIPLNEFSQNYDRKKPLAVVFGNEVEGVIPETLSTVDAVVHIPMKGVKESLNVGQSAAIFMRELNS